MRPSGKVLQQPPGTGSGALAVVQGPDRAGLRAAQRNPPDAGCRDPPGEVPQFVALVDVGHAGRSELEQHFDRLLSMPQPRDPCSNGTKSSQEQVGRPASSSARTKSRAAASYSAFGLIQLLCTFASRTALSMYACDALANRASAASSAARSGQCRAASGTAGIRRCGWAPALPSSLRLLRRFSLPSGASAGSIARAFRTARRCARARPPSACCRGSRWPAWCAGQRRGASALPVECRERDAEPVRVAADLVERHQPVVLIEGGVFHALAITGLGVLLEFHGEGAYRVFGPRSCPGAAAPAARHARNRKCWCPRPGCASSPTPTAQST